MSHGEGPSRRTVLRGAAWSAPVIALAVAAPSAVASTSTLRITTAYSSVWDAARRRYTVTLMLTNSSATPVTASVTSDDFLSATYRAGWAYSSGVFSYPLAANGSSPEGGLQLVYGLPSESLPGEVVIVEIVVTAPGFAADVVPVPLIVRP